MMQKDSFEPETAHILSAVDKDTQATEGTYQIDAGPIATFEPLSAAPNAAAYGTYYAKNQGQFI
jgi:hypothetical protein